MLPTLLALALQTPPTDENELRYSIVGTAILVVVAFGIAATTRTSRRKREHYGHRGPAPESVTRMSRVVGQSPTNLGWDETPLVWREGHVVIMDAAAHLPERCVRCNRPSSKQVRRSLRYLPKWVLVLLLAPLLYVIVGLLIQKKARVSIGLCPEHLRKLRIWTLSAAAAILGGIGSIAIGASIPTPMDGSMSNGPSFVLAGVFAVLVGWYLHSRSHPILNATYIDDRVVEMRGASTEFLDSLQRRAA